MLSIFLEQIVRLSHLCPRAQKKEISSVTRSPRSSLPILTRARRKLGCLHIESNIQSDVGFSKVKFLESRHWMRESARPVPSTERNGGRCQNITIGSRFQYFLEWTKDICAAIAISATTTEQRSTVLGNCAAFLGHLLFVWHTLSMWALYMEHLRAVSWFLFFIYIA